MADILYQTLEDRNNPDEVEQHGPYKCTQKSAWLGDGYYFWDYFLDLAKWWGRTVYNGKFIVCRQTADLIGNPAVLDLYADFEMIDVVDQYAQTIKQSYSQSNLTVRTVLEHMKRIGAFDGFKAVRIEGNNSTYKDDYLKGHRLQFKPGKNQFVYFEMRPPVQVCVYDETILNNDFRIIYPADYCI